MGKDWNLGALLAGLDLQDVPWADWRTPSSASAENNPWRVGGNANTPFSPPLSTSLNPALQQTIHFGPWKISGRRQRGSAPHLQMRKLRFGGASPPGGLEQYWVLSCCCPECSRHPGVGGAFQGLEAPSLEGAVWAVALPGAVPLPHCQRSDVLTTTG